MKLIHILFVLLFVEASLIKETISQDKVSKSLVNIGAGVGANYGGFGTKLLVGPNNSGIIASLGILPGFYNKVVGYSFGGQISLDYFYVNLSYGVYSLVEVRNDKSTHGVESASACIGGMVNLTKQKNIFLNLGIGHTFGAEEIRINWSESVTPNNPVFNLGIGYRLGPQIIDD